MNFNALTDQDIEALRVLPKLVSNPRARQVTKPGHQQRTYHLEGGGLHFEIYQRQNLNDPDDYSCGLSVIKPDGQKLTLRRYNGSAHVHHDLAYQCHIHIATAEAVRRGLKPERHAIPTREYATLDGALYCLVRDCAVQGLPILHPDNPKLFDS